MVCHVSCCYALSHISFFFFKQKTAYELRISDWSSGVCSSDLPLPGGARCPAFPLVPPSSGDSHVQTHPLPPPRRRPGLGRTTGRGAGPRPHRLLVDRKSVG